MADKKLDTTAGEVHLRLWCGESVEEIAKTKNVSEEWVNERAEAQTAKLSRAIFLTIVKRAEEGDVDAAVFLESRGFITMPTRAGDDVEGD